MGTTLKPATMDFVEPNHQLHADRKTKICGYFFDNSFKFGVVPTDVHLVLKDHWLTSQPISLQYRFLPNWEGYM